MKMNYTIYRITNPKGKSYIGLTHQLKIRMNAYKRLDCKSQHLIYRSLKKYGYDNHDVEYLYKDLTKKEAQLVEIAMIEVYKKLKSSLNISSGGETAYHMNFKEIMQFSLEGELLNTWITPAVAQRELGIISRSISWAAKGKTFYAKGYLWVYKKDYDSGVRPYWKNKARTTLSKPVHQYDRDGNFIATYPSCENAARVLGYTPNTVKASCIGKCRTSKDFIFSYTKRYIEPYHYILNKGDKKASKLVYVYDKDYNLLGTCVNATETSVVYKTNRQTVYNALRSKNRIVNKKYRFSYEQH